MNPRPLAVTIIGGLFIAAGSVGFAYHATELNFQDPLGDKALLLCGIPPLAVLAWFLLRVPAAGYFRKGRAVNETHE